MGTRLKYSHNENFFSSLTNESCYVAGVLAGDGSISDKQHTLNLSLMASDIDLIQKVKFLLQFDGLLFVREGINNAMAGIRVCHAQKLSSDLMNNFNITSNKTFTLMPPNIFQESQIQHFIRGILDSDGFIMRSKYGYKTNGYTIGFCGTKSLMEWISNNIRRYVSRAGIGTVKPSKNIFYIQYSGYQVRHILDWIYKDSIAETRLNRKYNLYQELLQFYRNKPQFRGVHWDRRKKKWQATMYFNGKNNWLGYFDDPIEAAKVYDNKAIEILGNKAKLNLAIGVSV